MLFSKLLNRGHARPGYGTDPFSGVEMPLHEDVPDGLIDVAESKHQKEGRVEIEVGEIHEGKHHEVHKRDLEDGTESRVARGTVSVILGPVSHTDDGSAPDSMYSPSTSYSNRPGSPVASTRSKISLNFTNWSCSREDSSLM